MGTDSMGADSTAALGRLADADDPPLLSRRIAAYDRNDCREGKTSVMLEAGTWQMLAGAALIVAGLLARRWTSRYDLDAAVGSFVWSAVRSVILGKRAAWNAPPIVSTFEDFKAQTTSWGKARAVAGLAAGYVFSQGGRLAGVILILAGLVQIARGYFSR